MCWTPLCANKQKNNVNKILYISYPHCTNANGLKIKQYTVIVYDITYQKGCYYKRLVQTEKAYNIDVNLLVLI